jgi:hypothetical protein
MLLCLDYQNFPTYFRNCSEEKIPRQILSCVALFAARFYIFYLVHVLQNILPQQKWPNSKNASLKAQQKNGRQKNGRLLLIK